MSEDTSIVSRRFIDRHLKKSDNRFFKTDDPAFPFWEQFIMDHKELIKENSVTHTIDSNKMHDVKFRLYQYMREQRYETSYIWIILFVNDIIDETNFVNLTSILIPKIEFIRDLYKQFISYYQKYTKD
jgi:hypothetical protein